VTERWTFYPNGEPTTVVATISRHDLEDGRAVLLFEAAPADVGAEERRAVEALRHTSALITLFDSSGRVLFANPSAFAAYGLDEPGFAARLAEPDVGRDLFARTLSGEAIAEVRAARTRMGTRHHHLETRRVLDPVSGAVSVLVNEIDVTARVEAEQAKSAAEQRAAMAEAAQAYLTEMSHELRTPLNAVIGFSDLLLAAHLTEDQRDQAARICEAGRRLLAVVESMIAKGETLANGAQEAAAADEFDLPEPRPSELRVLYVDDNDNNRRLVKTILEAHGMTCATANDGALGLAAARLGGWDVILMDIQMPVMDGVEATRAIRLLPGPAALTPIIAVTANTLAAQIEIYEAAGMNDLVAKPIDIADLVGKVLGWAGALESFEVEVARDAATTAGMVPAA
jgi:CheY-like chemotaxis protein